MRVHEIMTKAVRAVGPELGADDAWREMRAAHIRHLVVMERGRAIGIVSERDLGGARGGATRRGKRVDELMSTDVVAAAPGDTVKRAANLLRGHAIGCLPVVEGKKVIGIVTTTDLLDLIGRGAEKPAAESVTWVMRARGPRKRAAAKAETRARRSIGRGRGRAGR